MLKTFITNLGLYNEGYLVGKWIDLPIDDDELEKVLKEIKIDAEYEEYFFTDYECDVSGLTKNLGEYESIEELNEIAERLEMLSEHEINKLSSIFEIDYYPNIIEYFDSMDEWDLFEDIDNLYDLGYMFANEWCCLEIPDNLEPYFDYEKYGRDIDLDCSGGFTDYGYLWNNY